MLTTIRYFRDELEAHVVDKRCPAKVCRPLIRYTVNKTNCTGCHACFTACPTQAVSGERKQLHRISQKKCIKCDTCRQVCMFDAIDVDTGVLEVAGRRSM